MKPVIIMGIAALALGTTEAIAVTCPAIPTSGGPGTYLTGNQLRNLLNTKYACVGTYPNAQWNELHTGGTVTDYKLGATDPKDPSTVVGSYSVTSVPQSGNTQGPGYVTYTYSGGGGTYDYYVNNTNGITPISNPGTYSFCVRTSGTALDVKVNTGTGNGGC